MDQVGEISSVIQDHVEGLIILEVQRLFDAPHVLLVGLALPCVHYTGRAETRVSSNDARPLVANEVLVVK